MDLARQRQLGRSRRFVTGVTLVTIVTVISTAYGWSPTREVGGGLTFPNPAGVLSIVGMDDSEMMNPFYQALGTNGRSCASCHRPAQGWSVTPAELRDRFDRTGGLDPIFRTNDGSNCEGADVSTIRKRRRAFSLLLTRGVIRVAMPVPERRDFDIVEVDDPYGCGVPLTTASIYRRPLPATNLKFLSAVMWDGRASKPGQAIRDGLISQVADAVTRRPSNRETA